MSKKLDDKKRHCAGCYNNHYNHAGNSTNGYCWSLPTMKVIKRKEVHINHVPPWNQAARDFPDCYRKPQYVYVGPNQTC